MSVQQQRGIVQILLVQADEQIASEIHPILRACAGKVSVAPPGPAALRNGSSAIRPFTLLVCAGFSPAARETLRICLQSPQLSQRLVLIAPPGAEAEAAALVEEGLCHVLLHDKASRYLHLLRPLLKRLLRQQGRNLPEAALGAGFTEQLQSLAEHHTALVCRFLPDTTLIFVNEAYCHFFQLPREQLLGRRILDLIPHAIKERVINTLDQLTPGSPVLSAEYAVAGPSGERWYEWTDVAIFSEAGALQEVQAVGRDITQLKQSEQRYRRLFESMGDAALVANPETGHILDANTQAEMLFKRNRSELIGAHHSTLLPAERRTVGEALFRHHVREGGNLESKMEILRGDGKLLSAVVRSTMIEWEGCQQLVGIFHDVSSQVAMEQALRESEERFREFVEGTDNLVMQIDPAGRLVYLNRAAERLFRSSSSACHGLRIIDFTHPEDRARTAAQFADWTRSKVNGGTHENRMLGAGGEVRSILWTVSFHYDDNGDLSYLNGIGRDITEWKQAETHLRESEQGLRRLYEITAARGSDGARTIRDLLEFGASHFGLRHGLVLQRWGDKLRVQEALNLPAAWKTPELELICGLIPRPDGGPSDPVCFESSADTQWSEQPLVRELGVHAFLGASLVLDNDAYGLLVFFDASARPQPFSGRERELLKLMAQWVETVIQTAATAAHHDRLQARVQQAQKLESLGLMAGGVAHDFNNLLLSILGNADLLRQDAPAGSSAAEAADQIVVAAHRAAELTGHMLAYTGKGKTRREILDFNGLVEETAKLFRGIVGRETNLQQHLAPQLPGVHADATQLRQVLMNLIKNAAEAVDGQAGRIEISTGVAHCTGEYLSSTYIQDPLEEGEYVYVQVADSGAGMSPDVLKRIFDPFFTTKFTGRGLGLAAVMGIVRGHRGAVDVQSQPGEGTRFKILLPVAGALNPRPQVRRQPQWRTGTEVILVIEDEAPVRRLTYRVLSRAGFTVLTAAAGEEGIEQFRAHAEEIDLVLLDLVMAPMSGEEVYQILHAERPELPVLFTSGYSREEVAKRLRHDEFDFIKKPYEPPELTQHVRQVLERNAARLSLSDPAGGFSGPALQ